MNAAEFIMHVSIIFYSNSRKITTDYKKHKVTIFDSLYGTNSKNCPYDMLTDEVRSFCSNLKSCYTNLNNNNIKTFELKHKNTLLSQSVLIPKKSMTPDGIFPSILGKTPKFERFVKKDDNHHDSRLTYDKRKKKFYVHIVYEVTKKKNINDEDVRHPVVALDPGEASFMTYFSTSHYGSIGDNLRVPILKYQTRIKKLQSCLKRNKNKKGNKLNNRRRIKKRIQGIYQNIKNLVKELHNQTAIFLCRNYKRIIIPVFQTKRMISNGPKKTDTRTPKEKARRSKLNKRVKFTLNQLSHYRFRQHLIHKCNEYGCQIDVVDESYTSMCCTKCGKLSKNYTRRQKHCNHCGFKINRDINGARNILMKNHNHVLRLGRPKALRQ